MGRNKSYILKIIFIILFLIITSGFPMRAFALDGANEQEDSDESNNELNYTVDVKEFSEDYKRWLELPEEERNAELERLKKESEALTEWEEV